MKKIFYKILPFLIVSFFVLVYFYFSLFGSDAAFFITWAENKEIINESLRVIFLYKFIFWFIILNSLTLAIKLIFQRKYKYSLILFTLVVLIYIFIYDVINKKCAPQYYNVFVNQYVPEGSITNPIEDAGYYIGPYIVDYINNKNAIYRRYAILGISKNHYTPAIPILNKILYDTSEVDYIKMDVLSTLLEFNTEESNKYVNDYIKILEKANTDSTNKFVERINRDIND